MLTQALAHLAADLPAHKREAFLRELALTDQAVARVNAVLRDQARSAVINALVVDGDLSVPAGMITVGPIADGKGNVKISDGGVQLRNNATVKIDLQTDGDVLIGENTAAPATTNFAIFTAAQTYNSESVSAGDVLLGDNSALKANLFWDKSAGVWMFCTGPTTTITIDTAGKINLENGKEIFWDDSANATQMGRLQYTALDHFAIVNRATGKQVQIFAMMTNTTTTSMTWAEDGGQTNRTQLVLNANTHGTKLSLAGSNETIIQVAGASGGSDFMSLHGYLEQNEIAAPSTPSSGDLRWYADSTYSWGFFKSDTGVAVPAAVSTLNLPVNAAGLSGATLVAVQTHHQSISYADAAVQFAWWSVKVPRGWAGKDVAVRFLWAPSSTNTGNCVWVVAFYLQKAGTTLSSSPSDNETVTQAAAGTIDRPQEVVTTTMALGGVAEGESISLRISRSGTDGTDTFTGAARIISVELSVVG